MQLINMQLIIKNLSFSEKKQSGFSGVLRKIFKKTSPGICGSEKNDKNVDSSCIVNSNNSNNNSSNSKSTKMLEIRERGEILKDISITLAQEDSPIFITGASGSGKSTFLRCINFLESFHGSIFLNKIELTQKNIKKYRKNFGFVFQEPGLFPNMTAIENIVYAAVKIHKQNKEEMKKKAIEYMKKLNILSRKDCYPHQMSGGEKQKTSIIRSLILNPKIIFLDEPTSALDTKSTENLTEILQKISAMIVVVTHDMEFTKKNAKTILHFENGRIVKCFQRMQENEGNEGN